MKPTEETLSKVKQFYLTVLVLDTFYEYNYFFEPISFPSRTSNNEVFHLNPGLAKTNIMIYYFPLF